MRRVALFTVLAAMFITGVAAAATEEAKQQAIDDGLAWLAATQTISGAEGYWSYPNDGTIAATASAALAFIEEGYLPGDTSMYDDVVTRAVTYIFNSAAVDGRFGVELAVYERYAEDYSNDGPPYDEGNDEAIYFEPGASNRRVYTTGLVAPVVYALGEALGQNTVIGVGSAAINGKTYAQAMQDIVDWFSWGQVEPNRGNYRGGWRYDANYSESDNSTAQWGALPLLYAQAWGLGVPQYVYNELELWVNYIQNANGGSGYDNPSSYVNVAKTGGLLLELAAIGAPAADTRVVKALDFIDSRWNNGPSGTWYGNINHPYAMWGVYKGLQITGLLTSYDCGPGNIVVGLGMPAAPGGFTICFDSAPSTSAAGDWYSHYCDYIVGAQNANGSWNGYSNWTGALCAGWYINILNAVEIEREVIVSLDIKPTSCPNPLNTNSKGVLPVAILGKETFDVTSIDPSTVMLEGVAPIRYNYEDVATPFDIDPELCDCHELGPDGWMDMTLKFKTQDIVEILEGMNNDVFVPRTELLNGDSDRGDFALSVGPREYVRLHITGMLNDGREFRGVDCVRVMWHTKGGPEEPSTSAGGSPEDAPDEPPPPTTRTALEVVYGGAFGSGASINFALTEPGYVNLSIYDVAGRKVRTLVSESKPGGIHSAHWNGKSDEGVPAARGVYFIKLTAPGIEKTTKMLIME